MIYLALDQSLNLTGWAIFNDDELNNYGVFKTKPSDPIDRRLGSIWDKLNDLLSEYEFNYLFLEDIQKQSNAETYKKLAYVQAAIYLWCYWNNIEYNILSPSHWRKILSDRYKHKYGTKREEQKKAAQQFVEQQYNLKVNSDEADAINIGVAGIIEYSKNRSAF